MKNCKSSNNAKIIKGLEETISYLRTWTSEVSERCIQYQREAIVLLKEQAAKCLTKAELDDLNENQFVWIEGRTGYLYCLQIIGICREKTGISDIQFNAPTSYVERSTNRYGKSWRIWTNKPTEEQRQAVKWK